MPFLHAVAAEQTVEQTGDCRPEAGGREDSFSSSSLRSTVSDLFDSLFSGLAHVSAAG
jgi:hypothetical protein